MSKAADYRELVAARKACHLCQGLTNPADIERGRFDSDHVGPWSRWQGNLNAGLMVVGQDWETSDYFVRHEGREGPRHPSNLVLMDLVRLAGVEIGDAGSSVGRDVAFFTNAILCLKGAEGGSQGKVQPPWFMNCTQFLRRQIEIVHPAVVVGLGEHAYRAILRGFGLKCGHRAGGKTWFRGEVEATTGRILPNGSRAFAVYHCARRIRNSGIRPMGMQREDWRRLRPFLTAAWLGSQRTAFAVGETKVAKACAVETPTSENAVVTKTWRSRMERCDSPKFVLFMEQQEHFRGALQEYDPNAWFPPLPGRPTEDRNWLIPFVPSSWGRWDGCKYGVHFTFMYGPERGARPERIRLPIGVEAPLKKPFRRKFKERVIDRVNREGIDRSGFTLEAKDRGKLLEVNPIPFGNESWRIAMDRYKTLQPVIKVVSEVLSEYENRGAFEVPIFP